MSEREEICCPGLLTGDVGDSGDMCGGPARVRSATDGGRRKTGMCCECGGEDDVEPFGRIGSSIRT